MIYINQMDPQHKSHAQPKEILDALTHIWNHSLCYLNSMALKCAIELGIPDAIDKHGKAMTITELSNCLSIRPNKTLPLHQLMRLLVHSNFFSTTKILTNNNGEEEKEEEAFDLTINSQLLKKDHPLSQAPIVHLEMVSFVIESSHNLSHWFQNQDDKIESSYSMMTHGNFYEHMPSVFEFNTIFKEAMAGDSRLVSTLLVANNEFKSIMDGVESLVDVGGSDGTLVKAIAEAYPKVKCIVSDLPQVVDKLHGNGTNLTYVGGDMFEAIPRAQVVIFKWALHNWSDDNVIKILRRSKEAIPSRNEGGKLLIIEMVVGVPSDNVNHSLFQLLMDVQMLSVMKGKERTEEQWKYLFFNAGFSDYKISPILGSRSIIEVYPA